MSYFETLGFYQMLVIKWNIFLDEDDKQLSKRWNYCNFRCFLEFLETEKPPNFSNVLPRTRSSTNPRKIPWKSTLSSTKPHQNFSSSQVKKSRQKDQTLTSRTFFWSYASIAHTCITLFSSMNINQEPTRFFGWTWRISFNFWKLNGKLSFILEASRLVLPDEDLWKDLLKTWEISSIGFL